MEATVRPETGKKGPAKMLHTMYILSDLLSSAMASDHAESLTKNVQNSAGACRILQELRNSSSKTLKKCKFREIQARKSSKNANFAKFRLKKAQKMQISSQKIQFLAIFSKFSKLCVAWLEGVARGRGMAKKLQNCCQKC